MTISTPTPVSPPTLALPDPADRTTFGARMREMLRWLREDLVDGVYALAVSGYDNAVVAEDSALAAISVEP